MNKITLIVLIILTIGVVYKLALISGGNFFFNMDNGRDMVDVREMVILGKLRLTGPTSAIDGLYNGPAWYYLLAAPFILSGGDPYASIVMEIIFWAVGGFFLMKLVSRWGVWLLIPVGSVWIASDYIMLANRYAFNPNPVTLLTPLFIYLLLKYIESGKLIYSLLTFLLGGIFFNFEMNFGIFIPLIVIVSLFLSKRKFLKEKSFWVGMATFLLTLFPQIIFDIKYGFIMSQSVIIYLLNGNHPNASLMTILQNVALNYDEVLKPMMMHNQLLLWLIFGLMILLILKRKALVRDNALVSICFSLILVPFLGYLLLPVRVNIWHLGAEAVAFLILTGFVMKDIWDRNIIGKVISVGLWLSVVLLSVLNVLFVYSSEVGKPSGDPSIIGNELAAIDYVYQYAEGKNFKVYTYLPSVYDYPYQYLIWWYGLKKYGYLPEDYAYAPNKPQYIPSKNAFSATGSEIKKRMSSNLVFLIKEPDRNYTRSGWEGNFIRLTSIDSQMVGPLEIEIKKEL